MKNPFIKIDSTKSNEKTITISYKDVMIEEPNYCPFEHISSQFSREAITPFSTGIGYNHNEKHFCIIFQCVSCGKYCLFDYSLSGVTTNLLNYEYNIGTEKFPFDNKISKLSPEFKKLYIQSENAEIKGLNELAPMGL
ncbi:hypothetical protein FRFR103141_00395 [Fructilactobacillus fructivorans]|uniref:hypothetical protein n=1 Tax=Fructilactobacillus fructivorans TaxID=1614 RepID=UPI00070A784F|nr:hypothetical protein [Fructilactobacillus fructivorans]KRN41340.1 hypothetical protein IV51_GL000661 [Fructilactobacillus fructivorans]